MPRGKKSNDLTVFMILDGSGSMSGVQNDVVGGVNQYIEDRKKEKGKTLFYLTVFDTDIVKRHEGTDINKVKTLTQKDTFLGGGTALLDAVGKTITEANDVEGKKLVIIYTDGEENSSHEYKREDIKKLIENLEGQGDWTFTFMSADVDNFLEARALGVAAGNYITTNSKATGSSMSSLSSSTSTLRSSPMASSDSFYADAGFNDVQDIIDLDEKNKKTEDNN